MYWRQSGTCSGKKHPSEILGLGSDLRPAELVDHASAEPVDASSVARYRHTYNAEAHGTARIVADRLPCLDRTYREQSRTHGTAGSEGRPHLHIPSHEPMIERQSQTVSTAH